MSAVFPYAPNWIEPLIYRRAWRTAIAGSITGAESRWSLYGWPRRTVAYKLTAHPVTEAFGALAALLQSVHDTWQIPHWQDRTFLTAQAGAGSTVLAVQNTMHRNFEIGGSLFIGDASGYEVGTVANLSAQQITLEAGLSKTWPARTPVYPMLYGRMAASQEISCATSAISEMEVEVRESYAGAIARHVGSSNFGEYEGYPLFDLFPSEAPRLTITRPYDRLAFYGQDAVRVDQEEAAVLLNLRYLFNTKSDLWRVLDLFDECRGRCYGLWVPTWRNDISITAPFAAADDELAISVDYRPLIDANRYVSLLFPDLERVNRKIINATATMIKLDSPIGKDGDEMTCRRLLASFLLYCRFDIDELEVKFHSDSLAEVELRFKSLYNEGPLAGGS